MQLTAAVAASIGVVAVSRGSPVGIEAKPGSVDDGDSLACGELPRHTDAHARKAALQTSKFETVGHSDFLISPERPEIQQLDLPRGTADNQLIRPA